MSKKAMADESKEAQLRTRGQRYRHKKQDAMYISRRLLLSPSFAAIKTATAIRVYMMFLAKRKMERPQGCKARGRRDYLISNNGEIEFSYDEAERLGISRAGFCRAIDELLRVGLIDITHQGSGLEKDVSLYAISERWQQYGTPAFEQQIRPKRKAQYGFAKHNKLGCKFKTKRISQHTRTALEQVTRTALEDKRLKCKT